MSPKASQSKSGKGATGTNAPNKKVSNIMITNQVREVSKTIKHPTTGADLSRTAKVTRPVVYAEVKSGDSVQVNVASFDEIMNFAGSLENLAKLVQQAIDAKASYLGRLELSKAADSQKNLNKAVKALSAVYTNLSQEQVREMVLSMPGAREQFENQEIPLTVEISVGIKELLSIEEETPEPAE